MTKLKMVLLLMTTVLSSWVHLASSQERMSASSIPTHLMHPLNIRDSFKFIENHLDIQEAVYSSFPSSSIPSSSSSNLTLTTTKKKEQFWSTMNELATSSNDMFGQLLKNSGQQEQFMNVVTTRNVSTGCQKQVKQVIRALKAHEEYAMRMLDSFGKVPSGLMQGNFDWLGELTECRNVTSSDGQLWGKYALIASPLDTSSFFKPNFTMVVKYGTCVPNKCSRLDVYQLLEHVVEKWLPVNVSQLIPRLHIDNIQFQEESSHKPWDQPALVTLTLIGLICFLVLMGTLLDLYKRYRFYSKCSDLLASTSLSTSDLTSNADAGVDTADASPPGITPPTMTMSTNDAEQLSNKETVYYLSVRQECALIRTLVGFSVYTNTKKLFTVVDNSDQLKCLDAMRVMSIAWVVLGHTYIVVIGFVDNPSFAFDLIKRFSFLIVTNAFFSVDTFFMMSGLLTSYVFFRQSEKSNGRLTGKFMAKFYLHRYWRVTPPYVIAIIISVYLTKYWGPDAPLFPPMGYEPEFCRTSWWRNILFINNVYEKEKWCFGVSWYLANDMQFHFVSPVLLVPLAMGRKFISLGVVGLTLVGNMVAVFLTLYLNEGIEQAQFGPSKFGDFFMKFYIVPWCRVAPYLIGLLLGYACFLHKKKVYTMRFSRPINLTLWVCAIAISAACVFGLYPDTQGVPSEMLSRSTHIVYQMFSKLAWSLSLAYIVYACVSGQGGAVNDFLSWRVWVPLSRLTYGVFLTHIFVILYFCTSQVHTIHMQDSSMIFFYTSALVGSFLSAYVFTLFFEIPLLGLEKLIFH